MSDTNPNVHITITFRHTESTPALKAYANEKLEHCVGKYIVKEAEVSIILSVEKKEHVAEVILRSKGHDVSAKAITGDLYSAIDKVVDTVDSQLRKQKERILDQKHHAATQP